MNTKPWQHSIACPEDPDCEQCAAESFCDDDYRPLVAPLSPIGLPVRSDMSAGDWYENIRRVWHHYSREQLPADGITWVPAK